MQISGTEEDVKSYVLDLPHLTSQPRNDKMITEMEQKRLFPWKLIDSGIIFTPLKMPS